MRVHFLFQQAEICQMLILSQKEVRNYVTAFLISVVEEGKLRKELRLYSERANSQYNQTKWEFGIEKHSEAVDNEMPSSSHIEITLSSTEVKNFVEQWNVEMRMKRAKRKNAMWPQSEEMKRTSV